MRRNEDPEEEHKEKERANEVNRNDGNKTEGQGKWDEGGRINETEG